MRPTYALINLSNLRSNFHNVRLKVGKTKIMAVVKADAYGHGMRAVVEFLDTLGTDKPDYYAVAFPEEAAELRKLYVKTPVLVFEPFEKEQLNIFLKYDIIASIFTEEHLKHLLDYTNKEKIKVHIKVDTGMNRLGIPYPQAYEFIKKISKIDKVKIDGVYTHFATSDELNRNFASVQLRRFRKLLEDLKRDNIDYGLAHAANSGAVLNLPESYFDMVRPGILLYGYYPSLETTESIPVKPVMSLISRVSSVKEIKPGDSVSYGRKFIAKEPTRIVSVPIGYADGYRKGLTNKAKAIIKGKVYEQIGNVTMDRVMINIKYDNVKIGDEVFLLGGGKEISLWEWCRILNTVPYEVICGISPRVPRIYR